MSIDDQLRRTLEALSERLRGEITAHLELATKELIEASKAERTRAAEQITRDVRAEAEREISVRLRTTASDETIVSTKSPRKLGSGRIGVMQALLGTKASNLATKEESALDTSEFPATTPPYSPGREPAVADEGEFPKDGAGDSARLVDAIRALDSSRSLSAILDTLVTEAGKEAARAGLFLATGSPLRSWRCTGFDLTVDQTKPFDLPIEDAGIIRDAIRSGSTAVSNGTQAPLPSFAQLARSCEAIAIPIAMAGQVVAVLYADSGSNGSLRSGRRAALEVLVRYAAQSLELVTAFRAASMLAGIPQSAARGRGPKPDLSR
jgi:hypothetical protein